MAIKKNWAVVAAPALIFAGALSLAACGSDSGPVSQECPVYDEVGGPTTNENNNEQPTNTENQPRTEEQTPEEEENPTEEVTIPDEAEIAARLHGCQKIRHEVLGHILQDRGVDTSTFGGSGMACQLDANGPTCPANEVCYCAQQPCIDVPNNGTSFQGVCVTSPQTAGFLYTTATDSLSVPKFDSRTLERATHTTASAMKTFDIFVQSAEHVINNIDDPDLAPACVMNGQSMPMFDPQDGSCVEEAVSCLIGLPATSDHMLLCNLIVDKADPTDADDVMLTQRVAVAALLSAAHTCE